MVILKRVGGPCQGLLAGDPEKLAEGTFLFKSGLPASRGGCLVLPSVASAMEALLPKRQEQAPLMAGFAG